MSQDPPKEPLSVASALAEMTNFLASLGWQKLGLQPDLATGEIHKDLAEAKMAIDAASALAQLLEPQLDAEDKRVLQNVIRDLRVNYVEKVNE